jgi:bacteriorhodopsin
MTHDVTHEGTNEVKEGTTMRVLERLPTWLWVAAAGLALGALVALS